MNANQYRTIILAQMHQTLKPHGFRKTKAVFSAQQNDTVLFAQLQSSSKSTKDFLVVTVNLGILSRTLAEKLGNTHSPNVWEAHWRRRIGDYLPNAFDKWWEIGSESDATVAASEISDILANKALPEMKSLASTDCLRKLWSTGRSPGLSEYQRNQYMQTLDMAGQDVIAEARLTPSQQRDTDSLDPAARSARSFSLPVNSTPSSGPGLG
jgi:hypothetical protein